MLCSVDYLIIIRFIAKSRQIINVHQASIAAYNKDCTAKIAPLFDQNAIL